MRREKMDISHNESEQKFFVKVDGEECALNYKELSEKLWNFESASVPNETQKGILETMIAYAIDFVKNHNIKILVTCSDVQDFLVRHKDLKDLVYHPY
ncbi:MAG: N-acetyltransferase [Cytophagaceae bacterium]|nr:N-acetyltransferase [Cytophagaceae bacterium]